MFRNGVCAESVRPAFPSVTPTGHASIWTGAYANVNGVAAQSNGMLPVTVTSILDWTDGYKATSLRAEPIWITAARQGKTVYSHMATQSPRPPTYMPVDASDTVARLGACTGRRDDGDAYDRRAQHLQRADRTGARHQESGRDPHGHSARKATRCTRRFATTAR